jgi:hypothetical protein
LEMELKKAGRLDNVKHQMHGGVLCIYTMYIH